MAALIALIMNWSVHDQFISSLIMNWSVYDQFISSLIMNKAIRRALDTTLYQRRVNSVTRMPEPEDNFINLVLPFSIASLAKDRKTRSRDEMRSKEWWEDDLRNWSNAQFKKRIPVNRNTFHFGKDVTVFVWPREFLLVRLSLSPHNFWTWFDRHIETGIPRNLANR